MMNNSGVIKKKKNFAFAFIIFGETIIILGLLLLLNSNNTKCNVDDALIPDKNEEKKEDLKMKKLELAKSIQNIVLEVTIAVNNREYGTLSNPANIYYIPISNLYENSCILTEGTLKVPFTSDDEAYVVVQYDAYTYKFNYYFTFNKKDGYGMELTDVSNIINEYDSKILNPIPENAKSENITKQIVGESTSIYIFQTSKEVGDDACNVSSAIRNDI